MLCFNSTVGFPLSAPVLSWLFTEQGKSEHVPCPAAIATREFTIRLGGSSSACLATALEQGPLPRHAGTLHPLRGRNLHVHSPRLPQYEKKVTMTSRRRSSICMSTSILLPLRLASLIMCILFIEGGQPQREQHFS